MASINLSEFSQLLEVSVADLVIKSLEDDSPWLFKSDNDSYSELKSFLKKELSDPAAEIIVVGSSKYGYSIAPDTYGNPCRANSDIDIAVISNELFSEVWRLMLDWKYPWHLRKFSEGERVWAAQHIENHIGGSIDPLSIKIMSFGVKRVPSIFQNFVNNWFNAFKLAGNIGPARGRDVEGRIYASRRHLERYVEFGLNQVLKEKVSSR